jgi:uncharacterized membrane protein
MDPKNNKDESLEATSTVIVSAYNNNIVTYAEAVAGADRLIPTNSPTYATTLLQLHIIRYARQYAARQRIVTFFWTVVGIGIIVALAVYVIWLIFFMPQY